MINADLEMTINPWRQTSVLVVRNLSFWGKMQLLFGLPYRVHGSTDVPATALPRPDGPTLQLQIEVRFNGFQDKQS